MKLVWLPEAKDDIQRLYDFLVQRDPQAARKVIKIIEKGANLLLERPRMGRAMDDDSRRREWYIPFGAGAYVLRHRLHDDTIVIIRVWHSREKRS